MFSSRIFFALSAAFSGSLSAQLVPIAWVASQAAPPATTFTAGQFNDAKRWNLPTGAAIAPAGSPAAIGTSQYDESPRGTAAMPTGSVLRLTPANPATETLAFTDVPVNPAWQEVTVEFSLQAARLVLGPETRPPQPARWRQTGVFIAFLDDKDAEVGLGQGVFVMHTRPWQRFQRTIGVPEQAKKLRVYAGLWQAAGEVEIDDIVLTPSTQTRFVDATPPAQLNWGKEPIVIESPRRGHLSLDGIWKFAPAVGPTLKEIKSGWGYAVVPKAWNRDAVVARGEGRMWSSFDGEQVSQAWYARPITIPADWAGRAVLIDFERVSTDAVVQIDGKDVGAIRWPGGTVDLTKFVTAGKTHDLRVRVIAADDRNEVVNYMGYVNEPRSVARLDNRGIIRSVTLLSRPRGAYLEGVQVITRTRTNEVEVAMDLADVRTAGPVQVRAEMVGPDGLVEQTFRSTVPVSAQAKQTVRTRWPWANAKRWDVGQPNLYTLRLSLEGPVIQDALTQEFGFREFWIEGRQIFLNGTPFNLRPNNLQYGAMPKDALARGYNFGELWPDDRSRRGSDTYDNEAIAEADRVGLPISGKALSMADFVADATKWADPEVRADYQRMMGTELRRWRNHPSIMMWGHSANVFQWPGDGHPAMIGTSGNISQQEYFDRGKRVKEASDMMRKIDPTRPIFAHFNNEMGDLYTSNMYLNFLPLQEREEWLSVYATQGERPFMAVEFGLPLYASLTRGRAGYSHQGTSETFLSEWCARYLGSEAYALEPEPYREQLIKRYDGTNLQAEYQPHIRTNQMERTMTRSASFLKVQNLYAESTWRSWRTLGVAGGMIPWHSPEDIPALAQVNAETLAWIAGPNQLPKPNAPDAPALTEKTKSYSPGQTLEKTVVLINDARTPKPYTGSVEIVVAGKVVKVMPLAGTLATGQQIRLPVRFTIPASAAAKTDGAVILSARIGTVQHDHRLDFRIFAPVPKSKGELTVFDPRGDSTRMLKALGYAVRPWVSGPPAGGVVVIGRGVLSDHQVVPGPLVSFVQGGGRVLVLGQDPAWLRFALQIRTAPHVARRVFPIQGDHPVVQGLDAFDLTNWNGSGHLIDSHPFFKGFEWVPVYGWHWGNRHSVTSAPMEKPHRGSWRPILETEFDLAYTPLMEMEFGAGRITLCTLDLEDQVAVDPAAYRVAQQLLRYVSTGAIKPKTGWRYAGADADRTSLRELGVVEPTPAARGPIVVGNGPVNEAELLREARDGATVIVLRRETESGPFGARYIRVERYLGSIKSPTWPEARGLSASDLRWRTYGPNWVLTGGEGIEIGADGQLGRMPVGKGVILFVQMSPGSTPADARHYFRFTRWRQTRALSQVLANAGIAFTQDELMVKLLEQPDQYYALAGPWDLQLTLPKPESPTRQWNADPGITAQARELVREDAPEKGWETHSVPAYFESYGGKWRWTDGEVVYRRVVQIPPYLAGKDLFLSVGRVDETETTFFNGTEVGKTRHWVLARGKVIPGKLVRAGRNVIALRTWDEGIHGGISGSPEYLHLRGLRDPIGLYHPDYRDDTVDLSVDEAGWSRRETDWTVADNPYRYYRW